MLRRLVSVVPVAAVVAVLAGVLTAPAAAAAPVPVPGSMAAMGNSITRGFNACGWYVDCTSRSWSTGDDGYVNSHRLRLRALNPSLVAHNNSRSGARAADMQGQASATVGQRVDYVTIEIGANDACTSTEGGMTSVEAFRTSINSALGTIKAGLPSARVFIASIPDIKRLWFIGRNNGTARFFWALGGICQSMLANPTSTAPADEARRDRVRQRVIDFNAQLAAACKAYGGNCKFDGNAVFKYQFVLSQVSGWDYFHPNREGQRTMASITYAAGFTWSAP